jgi:ubiquinone/menaquinone biosynthesis C-methylase UbiE
MTDNHRMEFFDNYASDWDYSRQREKMGRIDQLLHQYLPADLQLPLLDLGTGTGAILPLLRTRFTDGGHCVAGDLSMKMLRQAREGGRSTGFGLLQLDGHDLPFRAGSLKTIVCFQVLPHLHRRGQLIRELSRVLAADGVVLVLHLMGHRELNQLHRRKQPAVQRDVLMPVNELAGEFRAAGFRIEIAVESSDLYVMRAGKALVNNRPIMSDASGYGTR